MYADRQIVGTISPLPDGRVLFTPADRAPYAYATWTASDLRKAIERLAPLGANRIGSGC